MEEDIKKYVFQVAKELGLSEIHVVSDNELEVIALIRNLPLLYDHTCFDFKNIEKKNAAWEAMAKVLDIPVGDLQRGWSTMRDTFRRHLRNKEEGKDTPTKVPSWFEDMEFVVPFIRSRSRKMDCNAYDVSGLKDSFTSKNTMDLIEDVRKHPVLYARVKTEAELAEKARLWQHFSRKYHTTVEECTRVWKLLRERWAREHRAFVLSGIESSWPFYKSTCFLKDYVGMRKTHKSAFNTSCNIPTPSKSGIKRKLKLEHDENDDDADDDETTETLLIERYNSDNEFEPSDDPISIEPAEVSYAEVSSNTRSRSAKRKPPKQEEEEEEDPDTLFGKTITAELKKLPNGKLKMKIKREIFELLVEHADSIEEEATKLDTTV